GFPGARLAARLETRVKRKGQWSRAVIYLLSSLTLEELQAQGMLWLKRGYWVIESRLHHCLDITLREDQSRVRHPTAARVVRSAALSTRETEYVQAARAIGARAWRIALLHVLPNCMAPYIIIATASLGTAVVVEASLSFLGLGVPPPQPSWGSMLSFEGREYIQKAPWITFFPGIAITLTVYGFNLLGDALRDVWDPRLRRG
ncbi:MAG: ABC transporter permease subunit, partial [Chloroflexota bacterium]